MDFGRAIAEARAKAKMSQADLAEKLELSTGTVAAWELDPDHDDHHGFRMDRLPAIADALATTPALLLKRAVELGKKSA